MRQSSCSTSCDVIGQTYQSGKQRARHSSLVFGLTKRCACSKHTDNIKMASGDIWKRPRNGSGVRTHHHHQDVKFKQHRTCMSRTGKRSWLADFYSSPPFTAYGSRHPLSPSVLYAKIVILRYIPQKYSQRVVNILLEVAYVQQVLF